MTRPEAHALLDALRAGVYAPPERVTEALVATGDLSEDELDDAPIVRIHRPVGTWERSPVEAYRVGVAA